MDPGYPRIISRDFPGIGSRVDAAFENYGEKFYFCVLNRILILLILITAGVKGCLMAALVLLCLNRKCRKAIACICVGHAVAFLHFSLPTSLLFGK